MKNNETGVIIDSGLSNWQILQQDKKGVASVELKGRWSIVEKVGRVRVVFRVMNEKTFEPISRKWDWQEAKTGKNGKWSATIKGLPAGGTYRLETGLRRGEEEVEWSKRGDMVHHFGVGDIWLILGQSNAAGYGKTPVNDGPELGVHYFQASGEWRLGTHPLGDSTGTRYPANREVANASHSPFLAFAKRLKEKLGYPIGLIPASLGGSPLKAWYRKQGGELFRNMSLMVDDASGKFTRGSKCKGALWYQGESDALGGESHSYFKRFKAFVADLRRDMRDAKLPVITAQLNRCRGYTDDQDQFHQAWEEMREIQRSCRDKIANVHLISTMGLAISDIIHTDSSGNLQIGYRMANTALGAIHGHDIKHLSPDFDQLRVVKNRFIDLTMKNVDGRLDYQYQMRSLIPFVARDAQGENRVMSLCFTKSDVIRLELERKPAKGAVLIGAPSAYPKYQVPVDTHGFLPMLGFKAKIPL